MHLPEDLDQGNRRHHFQVLHYPYLILLGFHYICSQCIPINRGSDNSSRNEINGICTDTINNKIEICSCQICSSIVTIRFIDDLILSDYQCLSSISQYGCENFISDSTMICS